MHPTIPRWRFWWQRASSQFMASAGFIFKSNHSPHNNLMVCYRPYPWAYKARRWGITVSSEMFKYHYPEGTKMVVIDLGKNCCISIHITPNRPALRRAG